MPELQVGGRIRDEDPALEVILTLRDVPADDPERLFGQRQRQEISEVVPRSNAEGKMLRHEPGLSPLDELPHPREVLRVQPLRTSERQARAVKRHGVVAADRVKIPRPASSPQPVLCVHLEPRPAGLPPQGFPSSAKTPPNPR